MPIPVVCPSCQSKTPAPESALGKKTKCPKCGVGLRIPDSLVALVVNSQPASSPKPEPLPELDDIEILDELDPTPPSPPPPEPARLARPVARPVAPPAITSPIPEPDPVVEEYNPFAGFVVPGSAAEAMTRDARKKRR